MLASENDALIHGKVGGVGDVVRGLPHALVQLGWRVTTIVPSYGFLHKKNPSRLVQTIQFPFGWKRTEGEIWEVEPKLPHEGIVHLVVEHPDIQGESIYVNDPPEETFARDANKFALFCSAIGQYLKTVDTSFVLHLHDWHTGFFFLLKEIHPEFVHLKNYKTVFTIHNLAIQGTRPIRGVFSTVEQWFPELLTRPEWIEEWKDPRYTEPCFTPMAAGIHFADKVNTVSPTYAEEILRPSDRMNGFFGGEGLEAFTKNAKENNRLSGILNGVDYPADRKVPTMPFPALCDLMMREVQKERERKEEPLLDEIAERMNKLRDTSPQFILTSVTRVVEQKIKILYENTSGGAVVMDEILSLLATNGGVYLLLGTGTNEYEDKLINTFRKHENFLYIELFSDAIGQALYANGTMFMMPSSFEPCGIAQMIAMRDGQPCIVHSTGGLRDTVTDGVNGFQFGGRTLIEQADQCLAATERAVRTALQQPLQWSALCEAARNARFSWEETARLYVDFLYI